MARDPSLQARVQLLPGLLKYSTQPWIPVSPLLDPRQLHMVAGRCVCFALIGAFKNIKRGHRKICIWSFCKKKKKPKDLGTCFLNSLTATSDLSGSVEECHSSFPTVPTTPCCAWRVQIIQITCLGSGAFEFLYLTQTESVFSKPPSCYK